MVKKRRLSSQSRKNLAGVSFILPWLIGFIIFFIRPLILSLKYSLMSFNSNNLEFVKNPDGAFANFIKAFTGDTKFLPSYTESLKTLVYQVPIIIVFSIFIGILLKQDFRGRTFMRSIFFLPIVINTGIVYSIVRQSLTDVSRGAAGEASSIFNPAVISEALLNTGIPDKVVKFITTVIGQSVDCVWLSGIQILIILAGLLSIPSTYYEVAQVEGGSAWVTFWKVTFPCIQPYILVIVIYTIVDSFSSTTNRAMKYIMNVVYGNYQISYGSALFWIYFTSVFLIIGLMFLIFSRRKSDRVQ